MRQTFTKDERLHKKILIEKLFQEGRSFSISPFRITWLSMPMEVKVPVQVLISIPRNSHPKAVNRNLLKRRIREAFRKNKQPFYEFLEGSQKQLLLGILYSAKEILPYSLIQEKIILLLQRLKEENEKYTG